MNENTPTPRLFVDFNNSDPLGRVRLNTVGTLKDLNRLGIILREGARIVLSSLELEADGIVTYSKEEGLWVAMVDWDKIVELPGNRLP